MKPDKLKAVTEQAGKAESTRVEFADGSALVTYTDGSQLILESRLARQAALREGRGVSYNEPPPPPSATPP
jgi:hypothetical protein